MILCFSLFHKIYFTKIVRIILTVCLHSLFRQDLILVPHILKINLHELIGNSGKPHMDVILDVNSSLIGINWYTDKLMHNEILPVICYAFYMSQCTVMLHMIKSQVN